MMHKHPHSNIPRGAHGLAERAWEQQRLCNPHGAIPFLEQALQSNPCNVDLLVLIAKQWSDSSFLPKCPVDQRIPVNEKALSYSTKVCGVQLLGAAVLLCIFVYSAHTGTGDGAKQCHGVCGCKHEQGAPGVLEQGQQDQDFACQTGTG